MNDQWLIPARSVALFNRARVGSNVTAFEQHLYSVSHTFSLREICWIWVIFLGDYPDFLSNTEIDDLFLYIVFSIFLLLYI